MDQVGRSSWRAKVLHIVHNDNSTRCGKQFHRPDLCGLLDSEEAAEFGIKQCSKCGTPEDFQTVDAAVLTVLKQSSELYRARHNQFEREILPQIITALETVAGDVEAHYADNGRFLYVWAWIPHGSSDFTVTLRWEHNDQHVDNGWVRPQIRFV